MIAATSIMLESGAMSTGFGGFPTASYLWPHDLWLQTSLAGGPVSSPPHRGHARRSMKVSIATSGIPTFLRKNQFRLANQPQLAVRSKSYQGTLTQSYG